MLQVVDIVSSFYSKDLSSCYSYGRLYRQHTIGWEGYRSAECNKRAVKRRGSVEAAKQAPNVSFRNGSINTSKGFLLIPINLSWNSQKAKILFGPPYRDSLWAFHPAY